MLYYKSLLRLQDIDDFCKKEGDSMPALQIKDCPEKTYKTLKRVAAQQNRSISQQMLTIIQQYLAHVSQDADIQNESEKSSTSISTSTSNAFVSQEKNFHIAEISEYAYKENPIIDYLSPRKVVLEQLDELPNIGLPEGYSDVASLVHDAREQRW